MLFVSIFIFFFFLARKKQRTFVETAFPMIAFDLPQNNYFGRGSATLLPPPAEIIILRPSKVNVRKTEFFPEVFWFSFTKENEK